MKKTILLAVVAMLSFPAFSQQQQAPQSRRQEMNPEQMATIQTQRLQQELQLDSLQYQAVFLMNYSDAMAMQDSMKVRRERGDSGERTRPTDEERQAREAAMKKRQETRNENMKQILTEEQYNKYLEYTEKQSKNRRPEGGRRGAPRGEQ